MKQSILLTVIFMLIAGTCLAEPPQRDPDELHPNQVAVFMRAKLEHAKKLLEGLATEDYDAIEKNAQQLSLLSLASTWQVLQTEEYVRKSEDFRRATDDIKKAAERKSLDGATLSYGHDAEVCTVS